METTSISSAGSVLVRRSVGRTLLGMAIPMLAGTFAMNAYQLADTWFVSRLGTLALAAMGFTFPVIMLLSCVAGGIGTGVMTLVSHAIGRQDHASAVRVTSHGILLTLAVSAIITFAGYLSITPIFTKLGADSKTLPLIGQFMKIWYIGALFMTLPMMGNGILISAGDSKMAGRFMMLGPLINVVLNPIMIFGLLGFPALGIRGSALATVISQAIATTWMIALLNRKHHLLQFRGWCPKDYLASFRGIVSFAVPSILSMILMPISSTVITRLLGHHGHEAVAAAGAAGRIEMFAFVIPMALGMSLTPFVSQNFGAHCFDRIRRAMKLSYGFALLYCGFISVVFFLSAPWLATLFTQDPKVMEIMISYIRIISFGYGMMEAHRYSGFFLTGFHKPASATCINAIRVLVFLIPLSCLGAHFFGVKGVFAGRLITDFVAGAIGLVWVYRVSIGFRAPAE